MTRVEEVIKEVAVKNGMGYTENDPLISLVTVVNRLTEDQVKGIETVLEHQRGLLEEMSATWREDAVKHANTVLNAALHSGREAIAKGMSEGGEKVMALLHEEHGKMISEMQDATVGAIRDFRRLLVWVSIGSGIAFLLAFALALSVS